MSLSSDLIEIPSQNLGETRILRVVSGQNFRKNRPRFVLLVTDGQMITELLSSTSSPITEEWLFVGIESNPKTRDYDYIPGFFPDRFDAHKRFVLDEVLPHIEKRYFTHDGDCHIGICGFSNGATFAHYLTARCYPQPSFALIFSAADNRVRVEEYGDSSSGRYYLAAGTLEPDFLSATKSIARDLQSISALHKFVERKARHNIRFWADELPHAIEWIRGEI